MTNLASHRTTVAALSLATLSNCSHLATTHYTSEAPAFGGVTLSNVEGYLEPQDSFDDIAARLDRGRRSGLVQLNEEDAGAIIEFITGHDHHGAPFMVQQGEVNKLVAIIRAALSVLEKQRGAGAGAPYIAAPAPIHIFFDHETAQALQEFHRDLALSNHDVVHTSGGQISQTSVASIFARLVREHRLQRADLRSTRSVALLQHLAPQLEAVLRTNGSSATRENLLQRYLNP
jgi:hypothetical protein